MNHHHTTLFVTLLAATLAVPTATWAQATPQTVEIRAGLVGAMPAAELRGRYEMADGRELELSAAGRRVVASLDGASSFMLMPTSASSYVSNDGRIRIQLHQAANGNVHGLTLMEQRGAMVIRTASR